MKRAAHRQSKSFVPPPPGLPRWFNGLCATLQMSRIAPVPATGAKSVEPPGQARWRKGNRSFRRGTMLLYIMIYMTIGAALMVTAGLCLHAILKSDSSERRESLFLSSLQRAEHQLRADSADYGVTYESVTSLVATTPDETIVQWTAGRGILNRTVKRQEVTAASDRYIFPAGSRIIMEQEPDNSVVIRITEPSAFVTYSQAANGGSNRNKPVEEASPATPSHVGQPNTVEIHLQGAHR